MGLGVGVMLTPSVNLVQSAFPEDKQGEISGLSRCVSNLGSSLGTAIARQLSPRASAREISSRSHFDRHHFERFLGAGFTPPVEVT